MKILKLIGHLSIMVFLTAITQIDGIVWLFTLIISKRKCWKKRYIFTTIYLTFNLVLTPPIASYFGREPLPWFNNHLEPRNLYYPLSFRNYAQPE